MKLNLPAVLLALACVGFGFVLFKQHQAQPDERVPQDNTINFYSNRVATLQNELAHEAEENATLSNNLVAMQLKASNLAVVQTTLPTTAASVRKAEVERETDLLALNAASATLAEKERRIVELSGQNAVLERECNALRSAITNLETQLHPSLQ